MLAQLMEEVALEVETVLDGLLPNTADGIDQLVEAMRYSTLGGGKRLRPFLTVATGTIFDAPRMALLRAGAAVELIHCYSLIHDDLPAMDDGELRRGQPCCHRAFDEATAILAGDALQALAFDALTREDYRVAAEKRVRLVSMLASAAGVSGMCGGQMLDLQAESQRYDLDQTRAMQSLKTGAIIQFSVQAGALIGDAGEGEIARLTRFAANLGLAFQIRDDMLDETGDSSVTGKDAGRDAVAGKSTFVSLMGREGAENQLQSLEVDALEALSGFDMKADPLRELFSFVITRDR